MATGDSLQERMDAVEIRTTHIEENVEKRLVELIETLGIILDAVTFLSGSVERLKKAMAEEEGWRR